MFIDYTYFYEDLYLAAIEDEAVRASIQQSINKREPEFMSKLLGYELYRDLKAGLLIDPIAAKWVNLLYGTEFTNRKGNLEYWKGLVAYSDGITVNTYWPDDIMFTIGAELADQREYRNTFLAGKQYRVVERGTGQLVKDTEYEEVIEGGFDMLTRDFILNGVYSIQFTAPVPLPDPATVLPDQTKESPIANYVYYWIRRNNATQTSGSGEKIMQQDNATNESPIQKQTDAWNEMVDQCKVCREYLLSNVDLYPQYKDPYTLINRFANTGSRRVDTDLFEYVNALNF